MTQRTNIVSLAGAIVGISATLPTTYDSAGYDLSGTVYTPVANVESIGNHGMTAAVSTFTPVDTAVTAKVKGSKDYGMLTLSLGYVPSDPGQALLKTASEAQQTHYSIELRYQDGETHYLDVIVTKYEYGDGATNDVRKANVDLVICRQPVIIPQA